MADHQRGWRRSLRQPWWCQRRGGSCDAGRAFRRWQCLPLDRTRVRRWGCGGGSEPRVLCPGPHLLLFGIVRRGSTNLAGLDAPNQGIDQGPDLAVRPNLVEISLTFSLLISTYHLNFRLKLNILISFPTPSQISA
jgi:hypothetical protein